MNRHRFRLYRFTLGLSLTSMTGLFCACSSMMSEPAKLETPPADIQHSRAAAEPAASATADAPESEPTEVATSEAPASPRPDPAPRPARESRPDAKMDRARPRVSNAKPAASVGDMASPLVAQGLALSAEKRKAGTRTPQDSGATGRSAPPPPASTPQWIQQGASAPGGDFAARDARINDFTETTQDALSTFAIDVDTAAYSIARRTLQSERMPTPSLVRVEEVVNYFKYDYAAPRSKDELFSIQADGTASPVHGNRHLLRVGIQAKEVSDLERKPVNLVFLVDTSGSMSSRDKLELTKQALGFAVDQLDARDKVAITTYAGGVRVVLPPTSGADKHKIKAALNRLRSGGGTAMNSGLELAYQQAARMLGPDKVTRIIVCSDGDANIGASSPDAILARIKGYVSEGVFLSTIGFGQGNYKDAMMETLANRGNGNYYYVDSVRQAERIFARDFFKMVQDVAQDVKIQVEMNPEAVAAYRLIGYENRDVADRDFRNDKVDAGEIGAGHQVTALYEVILTSAPAARLATVRVRAKKPRGEIAKEVAFEVPTRLVRKEFSEAAEDLRFATAVMGGAELMRQSPHAEGWTYGQVIQIVSGTRPYDEPDRAEFLSLMKRAALLSGESRPVATR